MVIKMIKDGWYNWKIGDIIEEGGGVATELIKAGRAVEWKGKNEKLIKNKPHNKKIKQLNNK